ncbi:MAG: HAMP domain-containing protein [Rhodanobacteraceae bacterium]|nr:MAG: HAMP domain-containing protein [Rhodanobacteraceae bacterium]
MTLRRKLLLVALSTLALPWAGWLYVRQMEQLLRNSQEQALLAIAFALDRGLVAVGAELPHAEQGWYVQNVTQPIIIDGNPSDWKSLARWTQHPWPGVDVQLAADSAWLYMRIDVADATHTRVNAYDAAAIESDHVLLQLERGNRQRSYLLASASSGAVLARPLGLKQHGLPDQISGQWQDAGKSYHIELRIPRAQAPDQLGIGVFDADAPNRFDGGKPELRPLLSLSPALSNDLTQLAPSGVRVRLLSADGWVIGEGGSMLEKHKPKHSRFPWLQRVLSDLLVVPSLDQRQHLPRNIPRLSEPDVLQALDGQATAIWRGGDTPGSVVLTVAVPLDVRGQNRGALVLEQSSQALPLLTNRALLGLMLASIAVLLIAGAVLFAFATWLSVRIGRLRDAAEHAQHHEGLELARLPLVDDRDELGDLARSLSRLLESVGTYTEYLRKLASNLSHELNTPLAIVRSSLENLEHADLPREAVSYLARARDGTARIGTIVRAMSEASRMERAMASADGEDMDLAQVVRGCAEAYRPLAAPRRLECDIPDRPVPLYGAPELIAQALDKLFDNALSFTAPEGWIRITLEIGDEGEAHILVANKGPHLPDSMQGQLFDSLVSVRGTGAKAGAPHLGLGLYVVRLVAELHQGRAVGRNEAAGVVFEMSLRGMRHAEDQ